ncbi:MAG: hypothetical protein EOP89_08780 [Lysobacteraceae bacterium]|nr:MAG: hypothetical protein EOP89_08780 [Xanthomonadaceae bacterium]
MQRDGERGTIPAMSRYYFHIENQESFTRDENGMEFDSLERVRNEASDAAGEILTSDLRVGKTNVVFQIQVEDGSDKRVMTLVVTGAVAAQSRNGSPERQVSSRSDGDTVG